jgi:hypothetical protein
MGLLLLDFPEGAIGKSHAMCRAPADRAGSKGFCVMGRAQGGSEARKHRAARAKHAQKNGKTS